jgi:hypothetical protein
MDTTVPNRGYRDLEIGLMFNRTKYKVGLVSGGIENRESARVLPSVSCSARLHTSCRRLRVLDRMHSNIEMLTF